MLVANGSFFIVFSQAWWFTRTLYTDLWGRWVMENNDDVWVYMDIPTSYRKGMTNNSIFLTFTLLKTKVQILGFLSFPYKDYFGFPKEPFSKPFFF